MHDIPNMHEISTQNQRATEWYRYDKCGAMDKNLKCLDCDDIEAVEYFEFLGMRYRDINAVTQRVSNYL